MSLAAGKLRHYVRLQYPTYTQDPNTGEQIASWADAGPVWAAIEPLSAREFVESAAKQSGVACRIVIRHREDVDATWRILYRAKIYNIEGVLADKESNLEYLTLPCSEGVSEGQ